MKYNQVETINNNVSSKFPKCLKLFDEINLKDDDELLEIDGLFGDKKVIDVDDVEIHLARLECKRKLNSTMDLAFLIYDRVGLSPKDKPKFENIDKLFYTRSKCKVQLVELRLNFREIQNLKREKLKNKLLGSTYIFSKYQMPINDHYIYVFKENMVQQARNRMGRMLPEVFWKYEVTDLKCLKRDYF